MNTILTEQEVKNNLAIPQFPIKWRNALVFASHQKDEQSFWNNVRQHFLESGGLFKHQIC